MLYSSIFQGLTKQVQVRIDAASELKKRLFDNALYEADLDWDTPTIGLNFEEIIGSYGINIAATTLDSDGKEPIMGSEGLQTLTQKVLNHAISYAMTIEEYRKVLQILDSKSIPDAQKKQILIDLMFKNVRSAVGGVQAKLDIIYLGALSNEGIFTFDTSNNGEGGVRGSIDYKMPAGNKGTVTTAWTDANIETVDCFADIQGVMDKAQDQVQLKEIRLAQSKLSYILRNKKMKQAVLGTDKSSTPLLLSSLNEFMQQNDLPVFRVIRRLTRVQNNGVITEISPWNADNIVFVPDGKLGVIKNAFANNELRPEPGVAYSNYGRVRISQWGKGETDGSNGVEFTKAQSLSLPVITAINGIYSLKTV